MSSLNPQQWKRILIIRLSSIGDVVLTTPVIRVLHYRFPHLKIDYLIKNTFKDLIAYHPAIDNCYTIPGNLPLKGLLQLRENIREDGKYDFILDLHDNLRSRILTLGGKIPYTRYNKNRFFRWLYVYWKISSPAIQTYITDKYFNALTQFDLRDDEQGLDLYFPGDFEYEDATVAEEAQRFQESRLPVTIAPGAAWKTKEWIPERFAGVADRLIEDSDATIAFLGGPDEVTLMESIRRSMRNPEKVLNFTGRTTLLESAKILESTQLHVANDSGLTHIATAFKKKVVVILGSTAKPLVFHPKYTTHAIVEDPDLGCRPCTHMGRNRCPLGHFKCMNNIDEQAVLEAINRVMTTV